MSNSHSIPPGRQPVDLDAVARDDQLLDLLGGGGQPDSKEPLIQALYAWRAELSADLPEAPASRRATQRNGVRVNGARLNGGTVYGTPVNGKKLNGKRRPLAGTARQDETPDSEYEPPRRRGRRRAIVAASLIGLSSGLGGVTVAAADAEPGSALWPITKAIFTETAEDKEAAAEARNALRNAREALADGRVSAAERYLDEAERKASATDAETADELREEADAVRQKIDNDKDNPSEPGDPDDGSGGPLPTPALPTPGSGGETGDPDQDDRTDNARDGDRDGANRDEKDTSKGKKAETSTLLIDPRRLLGL